MTEIIAEVQTAVFWAAFLKIIWIDILLSGDNALVIALACRALPEGKRMIGMIAGAAAAVLMRIFFTGIVTTLLEIPYLRLIGGVLLFYVAIKLLMPEAEGGADIKPADKLWDAIKVIVIADVVMSLDNVIAVAAAADGSYLLLGLGLLISIPLVISGASLIMKLLEKLPALVWAGAALLGWIAGEIIASDKAVSVYLSFPLDSKYIYAVLGACIVLGVGKLIVHHKSKLTEA